MRYIRKFNEGFVLESENYERVAELRYLMKTLIHDNEEYKKKYSLKFLKTFENSSDKDLSSMKWYEIKDYDPRVQR
jgi:hypothetical protein